MKDIEKFKDLNDAFNTENNILKDELKIAKRVDVEIDNSQKSKTEVVKDYEYTRGNLYSLIEKGQEAINGILELAQETDAPRAYEVAGQLIKSVSDATDKLMDLQKKLKDIEEDKSSKGPTNVTNNALFIGSTAELNKLLKQQKEDENI